MSKINVYTKRGETSYLHTVEADKIVVETNVVRLTKAAETVAVVPIDSMYVVVKEDAEK